MYDNQRYLSFQENKEDIVEKQHLTDVELNKLKNVIKTKIAGELIIKSSDLERILYLAGQNLTKSTVEKIKQILEETYRTDEYFLDEIEHILAPYWEQLTDEDIARILIESFEIFDTEQKGFIDKQYLIENLTKLGDMPLNTKDFQIIFSMTDNREKLTNTFDYHEFVKILCGLKTKNKKAKNKKKKTKKKKRIIKK